MYIYSPSFYQDLYQKEIKGSSSHLPITIRTNFLNDGDIGLVNHEKVIDTAFQ